MNFTVLAQSNDSLFCFTKPEVKVFLKTKLDLKACEEYTAELLTVLEAKKEENEELSEDLNKTNKKLKRTRKIAGVGIGSTILLTLLLLLK